MNLKSFFLPVLVLVVALISQSCCSCRAVAKNQLSLSAGEWALVEMNTNGNVKRENNRSFTLLFDEQESRISGTAQCNSFNAIYNRESVRKIYFDKLASTRMMCRMADSEAEFLQTLESVDAYTIDGTMLLLQRDGQIVMIFELVPEVK